jgi:hypothetical protein
MAKGVRNLFKNLGLDKGTRLALLGLTSVQNLCCKHCKNILLAIHTGTWLALLYIPLHMLMITDTLAAHTPAEFAQVLDIYNRYTDVSSLNINLAKPELLTINTPLDLVQDIADNTGITAVDTLTLLGVRIMNTYNGSRQAIFAHKDTKAIARQVRISSKAAHILHRRLIIQSALSPMYTHAFMTFCSTRDINKQIADLIKKSMWTQVQGPEAKQVRIQVAFHRIFAGYNMGGLNFRIHNRLMKDSY